ncbi:MAG TPA: hypothetical protein VGD66_05715 [Allosphingosinicella sp.]|jgi:hypothetical protein
MLDDDIRNGPDRPAQSARSIGIARLVAGIVLDIPALRLLVRLAGPCTSTRFVQPMRDDDPDGTRFKTLVRGLQLSSTDIRFVVLPAGSGLINWAQGNLLLELDACAGRRPIGAGR